MSRAGGFHDMNRRSNQPSMGPRCGSRPNKYSISPWTPMLGVLAAACGTLMAVASVPDDPQPSGALFWPALWCGLGIAAIPIARLSKDMAALLRAEHLLMLGLVYWLLMDPLQGIYPMVGTSYDDVVVTFAAIGLMT